jgi:hypothetical protein
VESASGSGEMERANRKWLIIPCITDLPNSATCALERIMLQQLSYVHVTGGGGGGVNKNNNSTPCCSFICKHGLWLLALRRRRQRRRQQVQNWNSVGSSISSSIHSVSGGLVVGWCAHNYLPRVVALPKNCEAEGAVASLPFDCLLKV